jgi:hypothetical protein
MPSSAVHRFSDADDYAAAIRGGTVEVTITERGQFNAKRIRIDFHRLWMQRLSESLPRVLHFAVMPGRAGLMFHVAELVPANPCQRWACRPSTIANTYATLARVCVA